MNKLWIAALTTLFIIAPAVAKAQLNASDIVVVDHNAGTENHGGLLLVDPTTGKRTVLSDFGNPAQGELGTSPFGLAIESTKQALVLDPGTNKLLRVNIETGQRTVVSDFSDPTQGPVADSVAGAGVLGIAIEPSGNILTTAFGAGSAFYDALLRVNPTTGARTMLSDFGNPAQGTLGGQCTFGVAVEKSGSILVTDCNNLSGSNGGLLFRIDSDTGQRIVVSDFGDISQGSLVRSPDGISIETTGKILVAEPFGGSNAGGAMPGGALFRVDPTNGQRTLLSDFGNPSQGATGTFLRNVAVEASGSILVVDQDVDDVIGPGLGALFRVNPTTGARTMLSDFGNPDLGAGGAPSGVAVNAASTTTNSFAAFNTRLTLFNNLKHSKGQFVVKGSFKLGDITSLIHPDKDAFKLTLADNQGTFFSETLPPATLKAIGKDNYYYRAPHGKAGIGLLIIKPTGTGQYDYLVLAKKLNLKMLPTQPVTIELQIGNHGGTKSLPCRRSAHLLACR